MIKCLTVMQPWASLIVHGFKSYETRSWITTHRGPLLIHASRRFDAASRDLATQQPFAGCLASASYRSPYDLPLGAIIGVVNVIDSTPVEAIADTHPTPAVTD
jgi:activating signal cointegrator 1